MPVLLAVNKLLSIMTHNWLLCVSVSTRRVFSVQPVFMWTQMLLFSVSSLSVGHGRSLSFLFTVLCECYGNWACRLNVQCSFEMRDLRFSRRLRLKSRSSGLWRHVVMCEDTSVSEEHTCLYLRPEDGRSVKRRYPTTILHSVTTQKNWIWI
jgi:hypothetical protein